MLSDSKDVAGCLTCAFVGTNGMPCTCSKRHSAARRLVYWVGKGYFRRVYLCVGGDVCVGVGVSVCACVRGCVSVCMHIHALAFVTLFSAIAEFTGCKCCG